MFQSSQIPVSKIRDGSDVYTNTWAKLFILFFVKVIFTSYQEFTYDCSVAVMFAVCFTASCVLQFCLPAKYPDEAPVVEVEEYDNIEDSYITDLTDFIKEQVGVPMWLRRALKGHILGSNLLLPINKKRLILFQMMIVPK